MHYFVLREVFLRHSLGRGASFAVLIAVALAIPWPPRRQVLSLAISATLAVAFLASVGSSLGEIWGPKSNAHALAHQLHVVADGGELDREREYGRATIESVDKVPPGVLAALKGRCVNAEPIEVAAVWALRPRLVPAAGAAVLRRLHQPPRPARRGPLRRSREGAGRRDPHGFRDRRTAAGLGVAGGDAGPALQFQVGRGRRRLAGPGAGSRPLRRAPPGGLRPGRARRAARAAPGAGRHGPDRSCPRPRNRRLRTARNAGRTAGGPLDLDRRRTPPPRPPRHRPGRADPRRPLSGRLPEPVQPGPGSEDPDRGNRRARAAARSPSTWKPCRSHAELRRGVGPGRRRPARRIRPARTRAGGSCRRRCESRLRRRGRAGGLPGSPPVGAGIRMRGGGA